MFTALAKELRGVMVEEKNGKGTQYSRVSDQQLEDQFRGRNSPQSYNIPTCCRCGQVGSHPLLQEPQTRETGQRLRRGPVGGSE